MGPWDGGGTTANPHAACSYKCLLGSQMVVIFFFSFGSQQSVVWVYYFLSNKLVLYIIVACHSSHPLSSQCPRNYAIGTLCKSF